MIISMTFTPRYEGETGACQADLLDALADSAVVAEILDGYGRRVEMLVTGVRDRAVVGRGLLANGVPSETDYAIPLADVRRVRILLGDDS